MRKNKTNESRSYVGTSFPNAIFSEIERLTGESHLRRAQLVRALFIRGLAAYYRDGKISHDLDKNLVEVRNLISLDADDHGDVDLLVVAQPSGARSPAQI